MAQSGYTPISLYYSTTPSAVPVAGNLVNGELAINIADGKLFYKDSLGVVQNLAGISGTSGVSGYSGYSGYSGISGYSGTSVNTSTPNTWTGTQTFQGTSSTLSTVVSNIAEPTTVSATPATGTINFDLTTQSIIYYTSNATGNWTINFRGSSGTSLNTLLTTGQTITCTFYATQGSTPYYNSVVQVDGTGTGVTTKWQGSAPTTGNASSIDVYNYAITKTGSATFTVLASQTKFS